LQLFLVQIFWKKHSLQDWMVDLMKNIYDQLKGKPDWSRVMPSEKEEMLLEQFINRKVREIEDFYLSAGFPVQVVPAGSTARGTFLRGSSDVDIFVVSKDYAKLFELAKYFKPRGKVKRGELNIWHYRDNGYDVDLVFIPPDYPKIETLKHTRFYSKKLTPEEKKEVIKLKALFNAKGVYKAEIGGITGVAIEELVRQHHTADKVCEFLIRADPDKVWLQDPTSDKPRNLLASINNVRWRQLKDACREYLEGEIVDIKPFTEREFKKKYADTILIECERLRDKATDFHTLFSLCVKAGNTLRNLEPDIESVSCDVYVDDKSIVSVDVSPESLSKTRMVCIPKKHESAIRSFRKAHPEAKIVEKDGYVCGEVRRKITSPETFVTSEFIKKADSRGYSCKIIS